MKLEDFKELVEEHAQSWQNAEVERASIIPGFNSKHRYHLEYSRQLSFRLVDAFKEGATK